VRVRSAAQRDFRALAIAGTRAILMAIDCREGRRAGLRGFTFEREVVRPGSTLKPLRSLKVFKSLVPDPKNARDPQDPTRPARFYTDRFPIQSFLWGDYSASPDTLYRFRIVPRYGQPGALTADARDELRFEIHTEKEFDAGHGVWFNRGAIASQKFAEEFENKPPQYIDDPKDKTVAWLSRGLLEACLRFIEETPQGDGLRVAAYEFTYVPVLRALKAAIDRGVDVRIVYHDTSSSPKRLNEAAMDAVGLPLDDQKVTFARTHTKIPHNKFIVRLRGGSEPVEVWTGSTNFTPSGFLGQSNVGHRIADVVAAQQYLRYWNVLKIDPVLQDARTAVAKITADPSDVIAASTAVRLFSPRAKAAMLEWYARRMRNAANCLCLTSAFGLTKQFIDPIAAPRDQMRFVLLERPTTTLLRRQLTKDFGHVLLSYGVPLGELYRMKNGKPVARQRIKDFELEKWFYAEEHYRAKNEGFVFFVHTKFLLIDPLSDDPLVCSGSANFSSNSLLYNDENMLLIRGNTRVADIYLTEFDRIFRHFYFRNIANELEDKGDEAKAIFLDESPESRWTDSYFSPDGVKANRRKMFFDQPTATWFGNAALAPMGSPSARRTGKTAKTRTTRTRPKTRKSTKAVASKRGARKR
jgi:phosphatidylserine/phosphatidylglycerophosphate/cardiolipin synthase-like enzyme